VIDSPEWVSRVTPPTTTIANTSAQHSKSQIATARGAARVESPEIVGAAGAVEEVAFTA
jgi:hypothetical protein